MYHDVLEPPEEAAAFYRQAVDKYVEKRDGGRRQARRAISQTVRELRRLDKARQEILRAIECNAQFGHASEPWKRWSILAGIETDAGNSTAAAAAKRKAIACYIAYRRDGGENHYADGRIGLAVTHISSQRPDAATSLLAQLAALLDWPSRFRTFIQALQAIVAGGRDRTLADTPDLHYTMAAKSCS